MAKTRPLTVHFSQEVQEILNNLLAKRKEEKIKKGLKQSEGLPSTRSGIVEEALRNLWERESR